MWDRIKDQPFLIPLRGHPASSEEPGSLTGSCSLPFRAGAAITFATVSSPLLPKAPRGVLALASPDLRSQRFCYLASTFFFFFWLHRSLCNLSSLTRGPACARRTALTTRPPGKSLVSTILICVCVLYELKFLV